ncbi:MAG: hypothetical protein LBB13_00085, partial [Rickettsiales bacterium]|nr:hypothetical protein [Rickettsiales bacterium]
MIKSVNFVLRCSLMVAFLFGVVEGKAIAIEVGDFLELQRTVNDNGESNIDVKQNIIFTGEIVINRSNLTISGPSENAPGLLDGRNNHKLLTFGKSAKNILLKNLHLSNGNNNDEFNASNGGGAIHLGKGVVVSLEGLTFSNNQTEFQGGAIYSRGTDGSNRNSLNFTGKTTFDGNKTIGIINSNGGAVYVFYSILTFGGLATFRGNNSVGNGGAIYGGNGTELTFGGDITFTENSSNGNGGAIHSWGENATNKNILKFEENATFMGNSATGNVICHGGAIYIWYSSLTFGGLATFRGNSSAGQGGAIYGDNGTKLTFGGDVTFTGNSSVRDGGAICSQGTDGSNRNSLNFTGKTIFDENKTLGNKTIGIISSGGAIYAENSSLTFGKLLATFKNNSSTRGGGAIYGGDETELIFGGEVIFTENSSDGNGGAIRSYVENATNKNILKFEGNATFVGNSTSEGKNGNGGAISAKNSSLTFGGLATFENNKAKYAGAIFVINSSLTFEKLVIFEKNSSDQGGAICALINTSIKFNNGLHLIENTTGNTNSGALYMLGKSNSELTTITIVQKNPLVPTEFRGNTSEDGGHNAVYMTKHSQLN